MTDMNLDEKISQWLEAEAPMQLPDRVLHATFERTRRSRQQAGWRAVLGRIQVNRFGLALGSVAAVLIIAVLGLAYEPGSDRPGSPSPQATTRQTVVPTNAAIWSLDSAASDWPGAPRPEPDDDPVVASALAGQELCTLAPDVLSSVVSNGIELCSHTPFVEDDPWNPISVYLDSVMEPELQANSFLDIRAVSFREECWFKPATCVYFDTVERVGRPLPHPQEQWIAFGVVADTNGDGLPDFRYGIDNGSDRGTGASLPERAQRMWRTDLLTGATEVYRHVLEVPSVMDAVFPGDRGAFFGPTTGSMYAHRGAGSPFRFYVWASLIRDGQVVATDYAPDAGWLEAE